MDYYDGIGRNGYDPRYTKVFIKTSDNYVFELQKELIFYCDALHIHIEHNYATRDDYYMHRLKFTTSDTFINVLEWLYHHFKDIHILAPHDSDHAQMVKSDYVSPWDLKFFSNDVNFMANMLRAGEELQLNGLIVIVKKLLPPIAIESLQRLKDGTLFRMQ